GNVASGRRGTVNFAHRSGTSDFSITEASFPPGRSTQIEGANRRRSRRETTFQSAVPEPAVSKFGIVKRIGVGVFMAYRRIGRARAPRVEAKEASRLPTCGLRRPDDRTSTSGRLRGRRVPPDRDRRSRAYLRRKNASVPAATFPAAPRSRAWVWG